MSPLQRLPRNTLFATGEGCLRSRINRALSDFLKIYDVGSLRSWKYGLVDDDDGRVRLMVDRCDRIAESIR